jgi:hypothetical protein
MFFIHDPVMCLIYNGAVLDAPAHDGTAPPALRGHAGHTGADEHHEAKTKP